MAYTVEDLLGLFRRDLDDEVEDYLWSDEDFYRYLDEAQQEFARLTDKLRPAPLTIPVVAGDPFITIPDYVEKIRELRLTSTLRPLAKRNYNELYDDSIANLYGEELLDWKTSVGTPTHYVADERQDAVRLVPQPIADDAVTLTFIGVPSIFIEDEDAVLTVTERTDQRALLLHCKAQAYEKHDTDIANANLSDKFYGKFDDFCREVKKREKRKNRRPGTVRYGGL